MEQSIRGMNHIKYEGESVGGWGENLDVKSMETWLVKNLPEGSITNPPNWEAEKERARKLGHPVFDNYWATSWNREDYKDLANIQEYPMEGHPAIKHEICEAFSKHNNGLLVVTKDGGNVLLKNKPKATNYKR